MQGFKNFPRLSKNAYERPSHYFGAHHDGTCTLISTHRDAGSLTRSNWECIVAALKEIEPEAEYESHGQFGQGFVIPNGWYITRERCSMFGWHETLRISPKASDKVKAFAESTLNALDQYPVFDEDHWSELETEEAEMMWRDEDVKWRIKHIQQFNEWARATVSIFAARRDWIANEEMRQWWQERMSG